jgi:hypothetical protein
MLLFISALVRNLLVLILQESKKKCNRESPMQIVPRIEKFTSFMLMAMVIGLFVSGCTAATERVHPRFPVYRHDMGEMLVLAPEIGIFEIMPDGSRIYQETRSHAARRFAKQAIVDQLRDRRFGVHPIDADTLPASEMAGLHSLFRSVNRSIQLHTIGPQVFPSKKTTFEYHLGPVTDLLRANSADGLVLVIGHQTGTDQPARNWISIAVVEPEGRIIWYGIHGDHNRFNLQTAEGMQALIASTMANFWEQGS